jgi:glycosyltransferase involved in cell wall biosynthesis
MANVIWWGRSDPEYSRNRLVLKFFARFGWDVSFFYPTASQAGFIEAYFRRLNRPDLIWVPCFRHRDIYSASIWARRWRVPLVIDPLISAYEKEVFEKSKWPPNSKRSEKKRLYESGLFSKADIVVADTSAHADFFNQELRVSPEKIRILFVGAEADRFKPKPVQTEPPFEILFYGSFLKLQGTDTIVEAAKMTQDINARWVLLGEGDLKIENKQKAHLHQNIEFEPWIPYDRLSERISQAHILLGIFGTTLKADLVIPNKMFQAMASGEVIRKHWRQLSATGWNLLLSWGKGAWILAVFSIFFLVNQNLKNSLNIFCRTYSGHNTH